MSHPVMSNFKQLRHLLDDFTAALSDPQALAAQNNKLDQLLISKQKLISFNIPTSACSGLQQDYASFLASLTSLLSIIMTRLNHVDSAVEKTGGKGSMAMQGSMIRLWGSLAVASESHMKWSEMLLLETHTSWGPSPSDPGLHNAVANIMAWLLRSERDSTWALRFLQRSLSESVVMGQVNQFTYLPLECLQYITMTVPGRLDAAIAQLNSLPVDFVPSLCYLACQQGVGLRSAVAGGVSRSQNIVGIAFILNLANYVVDMVQAAGEFHKGGLLQFYAVPPVIEVVKLAIILTENNASLQQHKDRVLLIAALTQLLTVHNPTEIAFRKSAAFSRSSSSSNSSTASPSATAKLLSRNAVSDAKLARSVCRGLPVGAQGSIFNVDTIYTISCLNLMYAMLDAWDVNVQASQITNTQCCISLTMARYCSSLALLWMRSFQSKKPQHPFLPPRSKLTTQQQQSLYFFGKEVMPLLRNVMTLVSHFGLQMGTTNTFTVQASQGQKQLAQHKMVQSTPCSRLQVWFRTAGRVTVFESLLRDQAATQGPGVSYAVCAALQQLVISDDVPNVKAFSACVSMSATLRKLLYKAMCGPDGITEQRPSNHHPLVTTMADVFSRISQVIHSATTAMNRIDVRSETSTALASGSRAKFSIENISPQQIVLIQLQSTLLISVVQICHWRAKLAEYSDARKQRLSSLLQEYTALPKELFQLLTVLLNEQVVTATRGKAAVGDALGFFASYFRGRLLPGCCHLGCTNLTGGSEAALPTLLCGGCKSARYCSVQCQKAAWVEGRHHFVCGK